MILQLELRPALELLVDDSASMLFPADLWTPLGTALDGLAASDQATRMDLGVQFFDGACDPALYTEDTLPLQPANAQLSMLDSAMSSRSHGAGSATAPALKGAIMQAQLWSSQHRTSTSVVLISASEPSFCPDGAAAEAASAARDGLSGTPAVPTYVVSLYARPSLDAIAAAGGTDAAVTLAQPATSADLGAAIASVADRAACEYALPADAAPYVPDRVNVTLNDAGQSMPLARVSDANACDASNGGFYYDDNAQPRQLIACAASCDKLKHGGTLELSLGCPSSNP